MKIGKNVNGAHDIKSSTCDVPVFVKDGTASLTRIKIPCKIPAAAKILFFLWKLCQNDRNKHQYAPNQFSLAQILM